MSIKIFNDLKIYAAMRNNLSTIGRGKVSISGHFSEIMCSIISDSTMI